MRSQLVCKLYALRQTILYRLRDLKESDIIDMRLFRKLKTRYLVLSKLIKEENLKNNLKFSIKA